MWVWFAALLRHRSRHQRGRARPPRRTKSKAQAEVEVGQARPSDGALVILPPFQCFKFITRRLEARTFPAREPSGEMDPFHSLPDLRGARSGGCGRGRRDVVLLWSGGASALLRTRVRGNESIEGELQKLSLQVELVRWTRTLHSEGPTPKGAQNTLRNTKSKHSSPKRPSAPFTPSLTHHPCSDTRVLHRDPPKHPGRHPALLPQAALAPAHLGLPPGQRWPSPRTRRGQIVV